jgi:hypothetical protein
MTNKDEELYLKIIRRLIFLLDRTLRHTDHELEPKEEEELAMLKKTFKVE